MLKIYIFFWRENKLEISKEFQTKTINERLHMYIQIYLYMNTFGH